MSQTKDLVRQAPAIAVTVGVLAFAYGIGLEAQAPPEYGCLMGTACVIGDQAGGCGYRSGGGGHCACFHAGTYEDTYNCQS